MDIKDIADKRFREGKSFQKIADEYGCSKQYIHRLYKKNISEITRLAEENRKKYTYTTDDFWMIVNSLIQEQKLSWEGLSSKVGLKGKWLADSYRKKARTKHASKIAEILSFKFYGLTYSFPATKQS